jgi:hypothetical protein
MSDPEHDSGWNGPTFWSVFISIAVIIAGLAAAMNFIVDPFDIYGNRFLPASELNNYKQKLELFDNFQPPPNALILGSSRVMTCDPELVDEITGLRCFNFWLPGSASETFYAIMKMVEEESNEPIDLVIVGVGVETVHPALPIQPEARYVPQISKWFVHNRHGQATTLDRIGLLFTMDQTVRSVGVILSYLRGNNRERTTEAGQPTLEYRDDGFSLQARAEEQIAEGTFDLDAKLTRRLRRRRYTEQGVVVSGWTGMSKVRMQYWEDFLDICREKDIQVLVFMTPAHPRLWELLEEFGASEVYEEVSGYFERTVTEAGGTFRDYTHLASFEGDPENFYDEMHMRKQNCDLLLRNLLAAAGYSTSELTD